MSIFSNDEYLCIFVISKITNVTEKKWNICKSTQYYIPSISNFCSFQ